ncbi:DNA helicase IV [Williamsia muralis]|uniref:DNA helicase IV n=2 Tax=Williamsia marianensis TaxID=85044 RepID=A0A495K1S5_WILMA|nr:DNA helicase IV [Williamsia muralis]
MFEAEQRHLDRVYGRLDRMRRNTQSRLASALRDTGGTPQARSERESYERLYTDDLTKFDAAEHNLYFGRLDLETGEVRRIGRIGILDDDEQDSTLLLDWRAPMSRPFYLATPASPEGVQVRRHIRTRNRKITAVNDERLDMTELEDADTTGHGDVVNESALINALNAARTGHMTDIVETIQREQDEIIRASHRGVLVVQGGPGTGKTAVALHRAAYLLYTYRDTLARSGVLIVGPNTTFLNYIGQVLPSLGESGVLLSTVGDLYPGVRASLTDNPVATTLKGDPAIVDVLRQAVRDRQELPKSPIELRFDGYPLTISSKVIQRARGRARSSRRPHNHARSVFLRSAFDSLAQQHAERIGASLIDGSQLLSNMDIADIRDEMRADPDINAALAHFWPQLSPQVVLADLLTSPERIASATPTWSDSERQSILRTQRGGFSAADAPLLDELAEIIGVDDDGDEERERAQWRQKLSEAQDALDILTGSAPQDLEDELDPEILMAYDLIDAEQLAARQTTRVALTTAERAYNDRTWAFGHVIVDEAQELSAMAWRMIMRRIPNRWMTVIGDTAQTGDPAGTTSWDEVLSPYVARRWRKYDLTVNYRTPSEIMAVAAPILERIDPDMAAPNSIRSSGKAPTFERTSVDDLPATAAKLATASLDGIAAIIAPDGLVDQIRAVTGEIENSPELSVLTVAQCKGLEFDRTVVVEPAMIVGQSARGWGDLYVALTRATQQLAIVHNAELPEPLRAPAQTV